MRPNCKQRSRHGRRVVLVNAWRSCRCWMLRCGFHTLGAVAQQIEYKHYDWQPETTRILCNTRRDYTSNNGDTHNRPEHHPCITHTAPCRNLRAAWHPTCALNRRALRMWPTALAVWRCCRPPPGLPPVDGHTYIVHAPSRWQTPRLTRMHPTHRIAASVTFIRFHQPLLVPVCSSKRTSG